MKFRLIGILILAAVLGGFWFATNSTSDTPKQDDGSGIILK